MRRKDRYDPSGLEGTEFEPGSRKRVLKNLLGITSKREMDRIEGQEQVRALEKLVRLYDSDHRFTAADVCNIHKIWLGRIYSWAGKYRHVNLKKDNFPFAATSQIPTLMQSFERNELRSLTPCRSAGIKEVSKALAIVHVELVLIHPFREGNGRVARLLSTLMALQAGLPLLDFSVIAGERKKEYFTAVQVGLDKDYSPMATLFGEIIEQSLLSS
ncbi:MAG: Fic family protein [Nitrospirales bacterium]|nr:Fic family protein [Nitrospirales bacterium]